MNKTSIIKRPCCEAIEATRTRLNAPIFGSDTLRLHLVQVLKNQLIILDYIGRQNKELCQ